MSDWATVDDAYGPATQIPGLLRAASRDPKDPAWDELWSRLCHQGSIYSGSFPAVAEFTAVARSLRPADRFPALHLAAAIIGSRDHRPRPFDRAPLIVLLPDLQMLAAESLALPHWPRDEFIFLMQSSLAFQGDPLWGTELELLVGNQFVGMCPACESELDIEITARGAWAGRGDHALRPDVKRTSFEPASELPHVGQWMVATARAAGQREFAATIPSLFGRVTCPDCGVRCPFPEAIAPEGLA